MFTKVLTTISIISLLVSFAVSPVFAISELKVPGFPSCTSPVGTLKVSYSDGVHGVPGNSGTFVGSDAVYVVSDTTLIQCFCAANGSGIQTNWWQLNSLSSDQIKSLQNSGWIYIPTGLPWGLNDTSYFAKNQDYNCGAPPPPPGFSQPGPGGAPVCDSAVPTAPHLVSVDRQGTSATLTWTKSDLATHYTIAYGVKDGEWTYGVPNTGNVTSFTINSLDQNTKYYFTVIAVNNCMPSGASRSTGSVLGVSTSVLGLANTGNWSEIAMVTVLAFCSLALRL